MWPFPAVFLGLDAETQRLHASAQARVGAGNFRASLAWSLLRSSGLDESEHGIKVWLLLPNDLESPAEELSLHPYRHPHPHPPPGGGAVKMRNHTLWELPTPQGDLCREGAALLSQLQITLKVKPCFITHCGVH